MHGTPASTDPITEDGPASVPRTSYSSGPIHSGAPESHARPFVPTHPSTSNARPSHPTGNPTPPIQPTGSAPTSPARRHRSSPCRYPLTLPTNVPNPPAHQPTTGQRGNGAHTAPCHARHPQPSRVVPQDACEPYRMGPGDREQFPWCPTPHACADFGTLLSPTLSGLRGSFRRVLSGRD